MKRTLHYLLVITGLFAGHRALGQELVYEQDHGVSFNKGTINTDVLIQLIQEKQEELNKFLLSKLVEKSVLNPDDEDGKPSRLDNFVTKYLVYSELNELTVTADRSKFGENTLQLLKEASMIYGLAATVNGSFYVQDSWQTTKGNFLTLNNKQQQDSVSFNLTLDMVLNICITDPKMASFFPLYGAVDDPSNDAETWYQNESTYYPYRNDSLVAVRYKDVEQKVNAIFSIIQQLRSTKKDITVEKAMQLVDSLAPQFTTLLVPPNSEATQVINHLLADLGIANKVVADLNKCFSTKANNVESFIWKDSVIQKFHQLVYDYDCWKRDNEQQFDQKKLDALFDGLEARGKEVNAPEEPLKRVKKTVYDELDRNKRVPSSMLLRELNKLRAEKSDEKWRTLLNTEAVYSWIRNDHLSKTDTLINKLKHLADKAETFRQLLVVFSQGMEGTNLNHYRFGKPQLEASKELLNEFIAYIDKSGKFNMAAIFLRSVSDNIEYQPAVDSAHKPTISLGFESLLFSLNDELVKPGRMYRTRYFQPYIQIGVNYADFVGNNQLNVADDGTTSALYAMTFASEKIGMKFKLWNWAYTHSFQPGAVYSYYCGDRLWLRPAKKPFVSDFYLDVHAGGLLYNVVNLNTEKEFNFPFTGVGLGIKTFNGLSISASYNFPFTNRLAEQGGWRDNGFAMLSLDIPIVEYITALRKK